MTTEEKAIRSVGCKRANPQCLNCADLDCKTGLRGYLAGYNEAKTECENTVQQAMNNCLSDIKEFTAKWEASDRKMDALHLKEVKRLKNYIENILFEISRADHLSEVKHFIELNKPLSDILVSKK